MVLAVCFMFILLLASFAILNFYNGKSITSNYSYRFLKWIESEAAKEKNNQIFSESKGDKSEKA